MVTLKRHTQTFEKNVLLPLSSYQKSSKMDVTHSFETVVLFIFLKVKGIVSEVFTVIIMRTPCLTLSPQRYEVFGMTAL
jgi:hypothetical protein